MPDPTESRTCPACGTTLPPGAAYCHSCGAKQPETVIGTPRAVAEREAALEAALRAALEPQYQLIRRIGRGGMGSVFLARDPVLKRSVSVKVLAPELAADETARTRFQREAQAVAALSHPNVVAIHSVGVLETGAPYFVMQHVEGGNLEERLAEEGPLEVGEARRILGQVASALAAAHAKGIIHRDVKPSNVLYDPDADRVLVSDFGIAAVRPGSGMTGPTRITQTGALVGTPEYMSPEQLLGEPVTEKTDIYGLGLLAYELLTGASPFRGKSPQMVAAAHLKDRPPNLGEVRGDVDPELKELARACLAKDPAARPDAAELARRLNPSAGGLLEWPPPGLDGLQGAARRPGWFLLAGSAAALVPPLMGVAGGVFATSGWSSFPQTLGLAVGLAGLVFVVFGLTRLFRVLSAIGRAVAGGHAWGVILEVVSDVRGDTGAVVTGSREYAGLPASDRADIRRGRVAGAVALALAAILPFPLFLVMAALAAGGTMAADWAWLVPVVPSTLLLLVTAALAMREGRRVGRRRVQRHRKGDPGVGPGRLIPAWYQGFRELVGSEQPGPGPGGRPGWAGAVAGTVGVLVIGALVVTLPFMVVTTSGGTILQIRAPRFGETQRRVRATEYGRRYRLAPDSTITVAEAGTLMARIAPPVFRGDTRTGAAVHVPADTFPGPSYPPVCDTAMANGGFFAGALDSIFAMARAGFTPDQGRCLRQIDAMPAWSAFGRLARAPAVDYWAATLVMPPPPDVAPQDLPLAEYFRIRALGYAAVLRAAGAFAAGRNADAERSLREVLSVGYLMIDDDGYLINTLVGVVLVGVGLNYLEDFYQASGQTEALRRMAAVRDSAEGVTEILDLQEQQAASPWESSDPLTLRELVLATATDTTVLGGLRWEMLNLMAILPCTNARELLFGPSPRLRQTWEQARAQLVRSSADSAMFAMTEETLSRLAYSRPSNPALGGVRLVGRFLGNRRLQGCAAMAGL